MEKVNSVGMIVPDSKDHWLELRSGVVTSTEVSALFNLNPYVTLFELWHRKKNKDIIHIEENERMKWGNYLESSIAAGFAKDNNWEIRNAVEFAIDYSLRAGSSFDYEVLSEQALLEIKNVDSLAFDRSWTETEAPPHIELQVQQQLMLTGLDVAYIGCLIGGNRTQLIKRKANKNIHTAIRKKIYEFWDSIENDIKPEPNFSKDAEFIASLYSHAEPGSLMTVDETSEISTLALEYKRLSEEIKSLDEKKSETKAKILQLINDSEKVKGSNFSISAGIVGETQVSYTRKAYRDFRIFFKKGGQDEK